MELLNIDNAREGMRVKLTNPMGHYFIGHANPAVGSEHECAGTIDCVSEVDSEETIIRVKWDNKSSNAYHSNTLSLIDEDLVSIWD